MRSSGPKKREERATDLVKRDAKEERVEAVVVQTSELETMMGY